MEGGFEYHLIARPELLGEGFDLFGCSSHAIFLAFRVLGSQAADLDELLVDIEVPTASGPTRALFSVFEPELPRTRRKKASSESTHAQPRQFALVEELDTR